jgi:UV DNA damage endonuclease
MPHQVGYCCINLTLQESKKITTSRGMILRTFNARGIKYASELALLNAIDLVKIIRWNIDNNIKVFRMSSGIFPWASAYNINDLPDIDKIRHHLSTAGALAASADMRLSSHPDHFVKLGSSKPHVVENSIKDLELHSTMFDIMGLSPSAYNPINIHVGMNYSDDVVSKWLESYDKLSDNCKSRLVVENDDKASSFSVQQLYNKLHKTIDIPITFDYFHHTFHPDNLSSESAARLAASTWKRTTPLFHYSESKNTNQGVQGNPRAHSDYVFNKIDDYGLVIDVDLECKNKELALLEYRKIATPL